MPELQLYQMIGDYFSLSNLVQSIVGSELWQKLLLYMVHKLIKIAAQNELRWQAATV